MDSARSVNPYASPEPATEVMSDAEREIRVVIRVFRYVGWFGVVFFGFFALAMTCSLLLVSTVGAKSPPRLVPMGMFWVIAGVCAAYLRLASRMARRQENSRGKAIWACVPMLLGFPLFTLIGLICIRKIQRHYDAYCGEHDHS